MIVHYHVSERRTGLPSYSFVTRSKPECDHDWCRVECACEGGEESLYHDGIEAGEIDEQCPCADCQRDRNVRFKAWRAEQEKAAAKEHTRAQDKEPAV